MVTVVSAGPARVWSGLDALDSFIEVLNRNQGATEFFLGLATSILTLALVVGGAGARILNTSPASTTGSFEV